MQHDIRYLRGTPVDYHFVRGVCDRHDPEALCIQRICKNRVMIYPPTYAKVETKDPRIPVAIVNLKQNSCSMIESFIHYVYLMSKHIKMAGFMPIEDQKHIHHDQVTHLSLHFLSCRVTNLKVRVNADPCYIVMECISHEPLFHLLQHMTSMFPNTSIYYNHSRMKICKSVHVEKAAIQYL